MNTVVSKFELSLFVSFARKMGVLIKV